VNYSRYKQGNRKDAVKDRERDMKTPGTGSSKGSGKRQEEAKKRGRGRKLQKIEKLVKIVSCVDGCSPVLRKAALPNIV
jgi:hypothetical protein